MWSIRNACATPAMGAGWSSTTEIGPSVADRFYEKRPGVVLARLREGYTVPDLNRAIEEAAVEAAGHGGKYRARRL